jgi:general secretion pathway protein N
MRKRLILLLALGLLAYLGFLIATLPAVRAWAWFGDQVPMAGYGLTGTVWSGQAAVLQDQVRRLEAVRWELHPLQLLRGRLGVDLQARLPENGRLRGELSLAPGGLQANDLRVDMPATALLRWAEIQLPVRIDGRFEALMQALTVEGQNLIYADGILNWNEASLSLGRQPLPLGNVALRLEPAENAINGTLMNQNSPLQLNGELRLTPDGKFTLDMTARLAEGADADARQAFAAVGVPADGSPIRARLSGALDGTGVRLESLGG